MVGLLVIDVVEGSAIEALPFMENIALTRLAKFQSFKDVIKNAVNTGIVKTIHSARVSMPGQVEELEDPIIKKKYYKWRTNLLETKLYWHQWFKGMS